MGLTMPTKRSMLAAGMTEEQIAKEQGRVICYVCGRQVVGLGQRDFPRLQAETFEKDGEEIVIAPPPPGTELGARHRDCEPSEHAIRSTKIWIAAGVAIWDEPEEPKA